MELEPLVERIAQFAIANEIQPGDYSGGSGHLSEIGFSINSISANQLEERVYEVRCDYDKIVTSEFTYEPDNPPYKFQNTKTIVIYFCPESEVSMDDSCLSEIEFREKIDLFVQFFLLKTEQKYGDCRSPIKYPAYYLADKITSKVYCFIDIDLGENETIVFGSNNIESMLSTLKIVFGKRFGFK